MILWRALLAVVLLATLGGCHWRYYEFGSSPTSPQYVACGTAGIDATGKLWDELAALATVSVHVDDCGGDAVSAVMGVRVALWHRYPHPGTDLSVRCAVSGWAQVNGDTMAYAVMNATDLTSASDCVGPGIDNSNGAWRGEVFDAYAYLFGHQHELSGMMSCWEWRPVSQSGYSFSGSCEEADSA